jgi:hypothetical protein
MRKLSISRAWDETKAIVARDGSLLTSVALALIAFPTAVTTIIAPAGMTRANAAWVDILVVIASLIALAGQLALIRLALGPSVTVGGAIAHGIRRMPVYFLAVLLVCIVLVLAAIPLAFVLTAIGVSLDSPPKGFSGPLAAAALLYLAVLLFVAVRVIMAAPAASAEAIGPIRVIRRSWSLTSGHWWRLLGFLLLFFIGAIVTLMAIQSVLAVVLRVSLGPIGPMSASALVVALVQGVVNAAISTLFAIMLARIYVQLTGSGQVSVPSSGI